MNINQCVSGTCFTMHFAMIKPVVKLHSGQGIVPAGYNVCAVTYQYVPCTYFGGT